MKQTKRIIVLCVLAAMLAGLFPGFAFAGKNDTVKLTVSSTLFVMQGASSYADVEAAAPADVSYKLLLTCDDKNITINNGSSGILTGNAKQTFSFTVARKAETGYRTLVLTAVDANDPANVLGSQDIYVDVVENVSSYSSQDKAAIEVSYTISGSDSLTAGQTNFVKLTIFNRGTTMLRNAKVEIEMPAGITIQSGPASRNIGTLGIGKTVSVDYPILVDAEMATGSYPIAVTVSGEYAGEDKTASEAIYVPLTGKDKQDEEPKDDSVPLLIVDSFDYGNGVLKRGADFTLKLALLNTGSRDIHNVIVNVLDPSGAIVPSGTSYIKIDSIKAGEKANSSIALRTVADTDVTQTSLSVDMKYYDPDNRQQESSYPIVISIEKKPEEKEDDGKKGGVTNPILMVTNYSFGTDNYVLAGQEFPLSLTITNTSGKTLRNIKVTVQDSNGCILPAQGSNSFFINSIGAGASYGKLLPMTVNNDAAAGNDTIAINMSYEDLDGGTYSSADTITIPVTQEDRLVIDDILDPGWLMAGEQGYAQIKYYNMGQTTLNNLRISVSGDFTIDGDSSQYVGNMANGRSDYFSFNFWPDGEGEMHGKAVFTYENAQGEEQTIEKEFTFIIQPAPEWEDPGDMPVEPVKEPMALWKKILIGAAVAAAAVAGIVLSKKHKKKKAEELELDD